MSSANWGIHILLLKSDEPAHAGEERCSKLSRAIEPLDHPASVIQPFFFQEVDQLGYDLKGSMDSSVTALIDRCREVASEDGPIAIVPILSDPGDLEATLILLNWLDQNRTTLGDGRELRVFPCLGTASSPVIAKALKNHRSTFGLIRIHQQEVATLEGPRRLLEGWAPPPNYWIERSKESLEAFRTENQLPPAVSLSGWIPDLEEGAKLYFYSTHDQQPPLDLQGTATMFFAMEEMGQISPDQYTYQAQDRTNVLVSVREKANGKLLGVVLFVGPGADQIAPEVTTLLASQQLKTFVATNIKVVKPARENDPYEATRRILTDVSLDCCMMRLESYLQGKEFFREDLPDPNEVSRGVLAGGTQSICQLTNSDLKLTVVLIFLEGNLKELVSEVLRLPLEQISLEVIRDFYREYLNQVVGWTQKVLGNQGVKLKIGLPVALTHDSPTPEFMKGLIYDAATIIVVGRFRFELRVSIDILNAAPLTDVTRVDVRASVETKEEVDIEFLLDSL